MITLRSYPNVIEAGLAKSLLEERGIFCSLADEGANAWGGAPMAMPVRLMVEEERAAEARLILEETAGKVTDSDLSDVPDENIPTEEPMRDVLDELKQLRAKIDNNTSLVVLLLVGTIVYASYQAYFSPSARWQRESHMETWASVHSAVDRHDYDKAFEMAQRLTNKESDYYYGYAYLAHIEMRRNRLKEAERYFQRAYELFPSTEQQQSLEAVRKRLAVEGSKKQ